MSDPGTSVQGGAGSPLRHEWEGVVKAIKIDLNAPAIAALGFESDEYPEGTRVNIDSDFTAWVIADAARITSGKQDARNVRILAHRVEGFSTRQNFANAYVRGIFPDESRLFNNGTLTQAMLDLMSQRLIVLRDDEE